jgi:hypothetical protein
MRGKNHARTSTKPLCGSSKRLLRSIKALANQPHKPDRPAEGFGSGLRSPPLGGVDGRNQDVTSNETRHCSSVAKAFLVLLGSLEDEIVSNHPNDSTGGKQKLFGISKRGNIYLRPRCPRGTASRQVRHRRIRAVGAPARPASPLVSGREYTGRVPCHDSTWTGHKNQLCL